VFVAVALAVFLLALVGVGFICHGFAMPAEGTPTISTGADSSADAIAENDSQPLSIPAKLISAVAAANEEGSTAYRAAQQAVDHYQTTEIELQDLLSQHFDDLLRTAAQYSAPPAEAQPASSGEEIPQPPLALERAAAPAATAQPAASAISQPADKVTDQPANENSSGPLVAINPQWQDLHDKLDDLEAQHTKLAANMLPTHPALQALEQSIADLQERLKNVPKEVAMKQDPSAAMPAAEQKAVTQTAPPQISPTLPTTATPKTPATASIFTMLLPEWKSTADQYRELTARLQNEKGICYQALNTESAAWQRKAQIPVDYLATLKVPNPVIISSPTTTMIGASPQLAIYWCGALAFIAAALVARSARVSEAVFNTAAEVGQRLAISILGFLPTRPASAARENRGREPRWIARTLLLAELSLVAMVAMLTIVSLMDQQFFNHLLANPLAACSQKFFC
jgi:hypothetical protein